MNIKSFLAIGIILILLFCILSPVTINAFYYTDGSDPNNHKINGTDVGLSQGNLNIKGGNVTIGGFGTIRNQFDAFGQIIPKYKNVIVFLSGILTVTMVAVFIVQFTRLGAVATNPRERQEVVRGLVVSGVSAAMLGSVTLIVGVFYGLFK